MSQYNFGVGTIVGKRTDVTGKPPSFLGVIQDIEIDLDQQIKELYGQYKMPVDVAPGQLKITGKAKFARIQASTIDNLLLGEGVTSGAGLDMATAEVHTPVGTTFTVTNGATFLEDFGLFYAATGVQLVPVVSAPIQGQYIPGVAATGTYTIAAADENTALNVYYSFTVTTLNSIVASNQLMGTGPVFELFAAQLYNGKKINIKLNACRGSKLTLPFKNADYTIMDFDFTAFADASNNWGTIAVTE